MKRSSYMTRALRFSDPRYARILGKLGYSRSDMVADDVAVEPARDPLDHDSGGNRGGSVSGGDDLSDLRAEYLAAVGRRPFSGWDAAELARRIAEAKAVD